MKGSVRTDVRLEPLLHSYDVRAMPFRMSITCVYAPNVSPLGATALSHRSPSKTSIAFHAGAAAMRGTSPVAFSYRPAIRERDAPMPAAGTTSPTCPLPRKGDGSRAGSAVVSRKVESRVESCDACCAASVPARSTASDAARATVTNARDGGPDFTRHPLYLNSTAQGRGSVAPCDPKL